MTSASTWRVLPDGSTVIDRRRITESDVERLADVASLTLWNVELPGERVLASLPSLRFLDLRGGTRADLSLLAGCTQVQGLSVRHVQGLRDLGHLSELTGLRILALYGAAQVTALPDLSALTHLRRLHLGQMRSLSDWSHLTSAPALEVLLLDNKLDPDVEEVRALSRRESFKEFAWHGFDESAAKVRAITEAADRPRASSVFPDRWLAENS